jgi:hypothetical protein
MGVLDGFTEAFNPAYQRSLANYYEQEHRDRQYALQKASHDAEMKERGLRTRGLERVDSATQALTDAQTNGIARNTGLGMATEPEYDASMVVRKPASERELLGLQGNLAAARGDIAGLQTLGAQGKALDKKDRLKKFMSEFSSLKDEELVNHPRLRSLLNDNPKMKGSVGYDPKSKKFIVTDYEGSGSAESMSRADIMDAAMQLFDESEGEYGAAVERGVARGNRTYQRSREGMADNLNATRTAHGMNVADEQLGIARGQLGISQQRLGIDKQNADRSQWMPEQYVDAQGNVKIFDVNRHAPGKPQFIERQMPAGLKPMKQAFDPAKYAETVSKLAEFMPIQQAQMQADQLFGRADPNAAVIEALRKAQEAKRPPGVAPKEAPRTTAPRDRIGAGGKTGLLTPRSYIEESARAGNPEAIRALRQLQQNEIDLETARYTNY